MEPALNGGDGSAVINKVILKRQKEETERERRMQSHPFLSESSASSVKSRVEEGRRHWFVGVTHWQHFGEDSGDLAPQRGAASATSK